MRVVDTGDLDDVAEELHAAVPKIALAVAQVERETAGLLRTAGNQEAKQLRDAIHDRSGTLDRSIGVSVRRVPRGGVSLRYGSIKPQTFASRKAGAYTPKKQPVFYADFVDRGTGVHGPKHTQIAKPGLIRMGNLVVVPSGKGQKPQHVFRESAERFSRNSLALDEAIDRRLTARIEGVR